MLYSLLGIILEARHQDVTQLKCKNFNSPSGDISGQVSLKPGNTGIKCDSKTVSS